MHIVNGAREVCLLPFLLMTSNGGGLQGTSLVGVILVLIALS
jgi:hypothetical protein